MAFLTVGGTTVPVAAGSVRMRDTEIGDSARAFDGTYRETIRSRVSRWEGNTPPLTFADASSVISTMNASTQPQTIGGTMISAGTSEVSGWTRAEGWVPQVGGSGTVFVVNFSIDESS